MLMTFRVCKNTRMFSKKKFHKAFGTDNVGGKVLKTSCRQLTCLYHPLYLQAAIKFDIPLRWRGSRITDLFKSGDQANVRNFREITIADESGKAWEAMLRNYVKTIMNKASVNTQMGAGAHHGACDKAHLALRSALDVAAWNKTSAAVFLLDVCCFRITPTCICLRGSDEILAARL